MGETANMSEVTSAIDSLRREMRHDLRDLRATIQSMFEVLSENEKGVVKVEGSLALMEQKCVSMSQKMTILKAEVDVLDADVKRLKSQRAKLAGNWQAIVVASGVIAFVLHYTTKFMGL